MSFQKLVVSAILCLQVLGAIQVSAAPTALSNSEIGDLKLHFCELVTTHSKLTGCELPQQYKSESSPVPDRAEILNCLLAANKLVI